jgi:hypothetical protein
VPLRPPASVAAARMRYVPGLAASAPTTGDRGSSAPRSTARSAVRRHRKDPWIARPASQRSAPPPTGFQPAVFWIDRDDADGAEREIAKHSRLAEHRARRHGLAGGLLLVGSGNGDVPGESARRRRAARPARRADGWRRSDRRSSARTPARSADVSRATRTSVLSPSPRGAGGARR